MINDRIRSARLLRGLSLDELAARLGDISKQGLSKFEKGHAKPNMARLIQLAHVLEVKPEYFFRGEEGAATFTLIGPARWSKPHQAQIVEQLREQLERYNTLEQCFAVQDKRAAPPPAQSILVSAADEVEQAAATLRDDWKLGSGANFGLLDLLDLHGIKVALLRAPDSLEGTMAAVNDGEQVVLALNAGDSAAALRCFAMREVGRWILELPTTMSPRQREAAYEQFAQAFLYPKSQVHADFGAQRRSRVHAQELRLAMQRYGLPAAAVVDRLKTLGLLSSAALKYTVTAAQNLDAQALDTRPAERPSRFESLVYRGLAEGLYTASRAAELLQVSLTDLASFSGKVSA